MASDFHLPLTSARAQKFSSFSHGYEDDGCQFVEAAVTGSALSTRSCTGQTHIGAASPRRTDQPHNDAMREGPITGME